MHVSNQVSCLRAAIEQLAQLGNFSFDRRQSKGGINQINLDAGLAQLSDLVDLAPVGGKDQVGKVVEDRLNVKIELGHAIGQAIGNIGVIWITG